MMKKDISANFDQKCLILFVCSISKQNHTLENLSLGFILKMFETFKNFSLDILNKCIAVKKSVNGEGVKGVKNIPCHKNTANQITGDSLYI